MDIEKRIKRLEDMVRSIKKLVEKESQTTEEDKMYSTMVVAEKRQITDDREWVRKKAKDLEKTSHKGYE